MKEKLIEILETFGFPVFLQGSLGDSKYPKSFFTFWNNETPDGNHYDNDAASWSWNFDVNFYSDNPVLVNTVLLSARAKLRENGFVIRGKGYDLMSDEPTHTGRGINALYFDLNRSD